MAIDFGSNFPLPSQLALNPVQQLQGNTAVPVTPGANAFTSPLSTDSFSNPSQLVSGFSPSSLSSAGPKQDVFTDAYNVPSQFATAQGAPSQSLVGGNTISTTGQAAVATVRVGSMATGTGARASNSMADLDKAGQIGSQPNSAVASPTSSPVGAPKADALQAGPAAGTDLQSTIQSIIQMIQKLLEGIGQGGAQGNTAAPQLNGAPKAGAPAPAPQAPAAALQGAPAAGAAGAAKPGDMQTVINQIMQSIQSLLATLTAQGAAPGAQLGAPKAA